VPLMPCSSRRTGRVVWLSTCPSSCVLDKNLHGGKIPALTTDANAPQFCFYCPVYAQAQIRHRRYFLAAYIAEPAPMPADDRAIAAALAYAREIKQQTAHLPNQGPLAFGLT